jgi:hypothetical protein
MGYFLTARSRQWGCAVSWRLQNQVCDNADKGLYESVYEIAVMRAMASYADDDGGSCFPSLEHLTLRSRCSRSTVQRVLKQFKVRKWINIKATGRSNNYRILPHGCVMSELQNSPGRVDAVADPAGAQSCATERSVTEKRQKCQPETSEVSHRPIRSVTETSDSYQILPSNTSHQSLEEDEGVFLRGNEEEKKKGNPSSVTNPKMPPSSLLKHQNGAACVSSGGPLGVVTPLDAPHCTPAAEKVATLQTLEALLPQSGCLGDNIWRSIVDGITKRRPLISSWLELATPIHCEGTTLTLGFPSSATLALESLIRPNNHRHIEEVVASVLGGTWKVAFQLRDDLPEPPALIEDRNRVAAARQSEQNRRVRELQGISVDDNNAHRIWERLLHQPDPVLEQISKEHNDRRAAGMARKILQQREAANTSHTAHP